MKHLSHAVIFCQLCARCTLRLIVHCHTVCLLTVGVWLVNWSGGVESLVRELEGVKGCGDVSAPGFTVKEDG